jgi:hypothetical protein
MNSVQSTDAIVLSAARWFWWIAALSLINTALFYAGSSTNFVIGLAMTTFASMALADHVALALGVVAVTLGFYFLMGWQAQRQKAWAFYLGLVFYALDALIYVKFEDWMSVAFHAWAMFGIFKGVLRLRALASAPVPSSQADGVEVGQ